MKEKIKIDFTHVQCTEDVWIGLQIDEDIIKIDCCRLTLEQIIDLDLVNILGGTKDDGNILDLEYEETRVVNHSLPLIQWSVKENNSITKKFQSIMDKNNAWINIKCIKMKRFKSRSSNDTIAPMGWKSNVRTKKKEYFSFLGARIKINFKSKDKSQEEPSKKGKRKFVIQKIVEEEDDQWEEEEEVKVLLVTMDVQSTLV